ASPRLVSAAYFETIRMHIVAGRGFTPADTDSSPPVIVVSQSFARKYLGDHPIGARVPFIAGYQFGPGNTQPPDGEVVGVVDDLRYVTSIAGSHPEIYYSFGQLKARLGVSTVTLFLRTTQDPIALAQPLRTAVRNADSRLVAEA